MSIVTPQCECGAELVLVGVSLICFRCDHEDRGKQVEVSMEAMGFHRTMTSASTEQQKAVNP